MPNNGVTSNKICHEKYNAIKHFWWRNKMNQDSLSIGEVASSNGALPGGD